MLGKDWAKLRVVGKLDDPHLAVLVGAEVGGEVVERLLDRVDHPVDVVVVRLVVVDLDGDVVPAVAPHL